MLKIEIASSVNPAPCPSLTTNHNVHLLEELVSGKVDERCVIKAAPKKATGR